MNDGLASQICSILSTMKADQKWTERHDEAYLIGLIEIPDEIALILRREILRRWDWRPSVKEIIDLVDEMSSSKSKLTAIDAVAAIYAAISTEQFEEVIRVERRFIEDPGHTENARAIAEAARDNMPRPDVPKVTGRWENIDVPYKVRVSHCPASITESPVLSAIVAAMGGWSAVSTGPGENTPSGVFRGQLMKIAQAVVANESAQFIKALRVEYREMKALGDDGLYLVDTSTCGEDVRMTGIDSVLRLIG